MNKTVRNVLATIAGIVVGWVINGGMIEVLPSILTYPEGFDNSSMDALKSTMHLLEPQHMISIFVAHALGTFVGAYVASRIAVGRKMIPSFIVGVFFLIGGVTMVYMVGGPGWFIALDLLMAYLPMAKAANWLVMKAETAKSN